MKQHIIDEKYHKIEAVNPSPSLRLTVGKITCAIGDGLYEIESQSSFNVARVSFSCLVRPIAGDRILMSCGPEGNFILAIHERLIPDHGTIGFPSKGMMTIEASGIVLKGENEVSVDAGSIALRGRKLNIIVDTMNVVSNLANWISKHLRTSTRSCEIVAETLSMKAMDRVAVIEGADVLHAQSLSQTVDGVAVTSAPSVIIATTEDLRLDGKRVTVG